MPIERSWIYSVKKFPAIDEYDVYITRSSIGAHYRFRNNGLSYFVMHTEFLRSQDAFNLAGSAP